MSLRIIDSAVDAPEALALMDQLSARLAAITGDDGRRNFSIDPAADGTAFVLALSGERAVGCGALRPLDGHAGVAEIKRMYAQAPGQGIGSAVLAALEARAAALGYGVLWLETRAVNTAAVSFYLHHGYRVRANYGPYVGREEAVCFEKNLPASAFAMLAVSSA